jgi:hypothetical protein
MLQKLLFARLSLAVVVVVVVVVLSVPFLAATASESRQGTEEGNTMTIGTARPPIDVAAPAKTETATFALG